MLKTKSIFIETRRLDDGRFFLIGRTKDRLPLRVIDWQRLFFHRHAESFYGTFLDVDVIDGSEGVVLDGWQLVSLYAKEPFNQLIQWQLCEVSEMCLAISHIMYEAIVEKDWLPDFHALAEDEFRWMLPDRVKQEFDPTFWDEEIEGSTADSYMTDLFNDALTRYVKRNSAGLAGFAEKLESLKKKEIHPQHLATYFDEQSWAEWIGLKENLTPFEIGLRLEEPADGEGDWELTTFLHEKKGNRIIDWSVDIKLPARWVEFSDKVENEQQRWMAIFPWLRDGEIAATKTDGDTVPTLKTALSEEEAWLFLTEASETLLAFGVEIMLPAWWKAMKDASLKVKARVKGNSASHRPSFVGLQAMLDFDWRFSMNGVDLSEADFNRLVEEKRRLVYVNGRWIKLDPQFIRQIQELVKKAEKEGLHIRDLLEQELLSDEGAVEDEHANPKAFARIQIELNRQWKQMMKQLNEIKEIPEAPVPTGLNGELRPYQQLGMSWLLFLRKFGFGACLADDMGLGKTIQLISYLLSVKDQETSGPALIICPTSVLGNWQKELEKFAPELNVYLHYGANRLKEEAFSEKAWQSDVVLTSYGLSHLDIAEFESVTWSSIAIDEAQNIKNAQTKQSRAVRKLKAKHHIALTGTPMENRLNELWSIFDFTNHGYLGSLGAFHKRFVLPIEKDDRPEKIKELQALIRPFLLRRTKKDEEVALNLPDKLEQKEYCPLTAEQASLYEQLVRDTFAEIEKLSGFERKGLILQMLSRLKQLCNHPALYLKETAPTDTLERSTKLEKLVELIGAVIEQGESCLIFTQYLEMGEIIRQALMKEYGIEVPFLNGSVPKAKRDEMITRFQNREFPVFLLSLKAGGTGLNLTAANHVIHYDRWWNPAVENQATDRAYRIGQSRFVHVHKLICTGTLEEKIDDMLEKKQSLNDQIIQSDQWITELSTDDLRDLVLLS